MSRAWLLVLVAGCADQPALTQPWQLDHDRIVAVRASPPALRPGQRSIIDGLVAFGSEPPRELAPDGVVLGQSVDGIAIELVDGRWSVAAAPEVASSAPLELEVQFGPLAARKRLLFGEDATEPVIREVHANELDITGLHTFTVSPERELALHIVARDDDEVMWLTSCGELVDHDLADAYLTAQRRAACDLAVVVRASSGGVAWQLWSVSSL